MSVKPTNQTDFIYKGYFQEEDAERTSSPETDYQAANSDPDSSPERPMHTPRSFLSISSSEDEPYPISLSSSTSDLTTSTTEEVAGRYLVGLDSSQAEEVGDNYILTLADLPRRESLSGYDDEIAISEKEAEPSDSVMSEIRESYKVRAKVDALQERIRSNHLLTKKEAKPIKKKLLKAKEFILHAQRYEYNKLDKSISKTLKALDRATEVKRTGFEFKLDQCIETLTHKENNYIGAIGRGYIWNELQEGKQAHQESLQEMKRIPPSSKRIIEKIKQAEFLLNTY